MFNQSREIPTICPSADCEEGALFRIRHQARGVVDLKEVGFVVGVETEIEAPKVTTTNLGISLAGEVNNLGFESAGERSGTELGLVHWDDAGGAVDELSLVAIDCGCVTRQPREVDLNDWENR